MIVSIVKGKCRDISSVSQRVGEGRIVNGSFLNCIFIVLEIYTTIGIEIFEGDFSNNDLSSKSI